MLASAGPEIADAVRYHAERWDGAGPAALVEDDIPLSARIIAVAKAVDLGLQPGNGDEAAGNPAELIQSLQTESGTRFDPNVIDTLARLLGA